MHGSIVTTYQGEETTVCPDATATMTEIETPTAEALSCYPTHGSADVEEFFKFCGFGSDQLHEACQTGMGDKGVGVQCVQPIKDIYNPLPHYYNEFRMILERADDAPDDCKYLFPDPQDRNIDEIREGMASRIDALCVPMLQEIAGECTWNGGEVKNQCGTFKFQSCVEGKGCKWGDPGFDG